MIGNAYCTIGFLFHAIICNCKLRWIIRCTDVITNAQFTSTVSIKFIHYCIYLSAHFIKHLNCVRMYVLSQQKKQTSVPYTFKFARISYNSSIATIIHVQKSTKGGCTSFELDTSLSTNIKYDQNNENTFEECVELSNILFSVCLQRTHAT